MVSVIPDRNEKRRIMVVDDDENILEFIKISLENNGYAVVTSPTATEALSKIRISKTEFPVILTDLIMPGIDGIEFLKLIKKEYPATVIIMLTGNMSLENAIRAMDEGAFAYLTKPINFRELKAIIRNAYEHYQLIKENESLKQQLKESNKSKLDLEVEGEQIYIVVSFTSVGEIKNANKGLEKLLGYQENELAGKKIEQIFSNKFQKERLQSLFKENKVIDFPVEFRTKSNKELRVVFSGSVMKDSELHPIGLLGTVQREEE